MRCFSLTWPVAAALLLGWGGGLVGRAATTNVVSGVYSNVGGVFTLGGGGSTDTLIITNGGWLENTSGILGPSADSGNSLAFVGGSNSIWDNKGELFVGQAGSGNRLVITNGGRVNAALSYIGYGAESGGNSVLLQGPGAVWNSGGGLQVGASGSENRVTVTQGGRLLTGGFSAIGYNEPASNNTLSVIGAGTYWFGDVIAVGSYGANRDQLTIADGAQVSSVYGYLGNGAENVAVVTGAGSAWNNLGAFFVGNEGQNNRLIVTNGGRVSSAGGIISGDANLALITGTNSVWETGGPETQLVIGAYGASSQLAIVSGGRVNSRSGIVTGNSNLVTVTGPGTVWNNRESMRVGEELGEGNQLLVSDSAQVASGALNLAGDGGILSIRGAGSILSSTGLVSIGAETGARNNLRIAEGGRLSSAAGYVGGLDSSFFTGQNNGNVATVTGLGSVWENAGNLVVGSTGSGNHLTVADGGQVSNLNGYLGLNGAGGNNQVKVTGTNSVWQNAQDLIVGYAGSNNRLVVTNGGLVSSVNGLIGRNNNQNNSVTVGGAGSLWDIREHLGVGNSGTGNQLVIAAGGRVNSTAASIDAPAGTPNARTNQVLVTGADSLWANRGAVMVGASSSFNQLRLESGGTLSAASLQVGNDELSYNNVLTVRGGSLLMTNGGTSGTLDIRRGTVLLEGGSIEAGRLVVASGPLSVFSFTEGTLATRATTVANGRAFEVGGGGLAAGLELRGGLHSFADGLRVASGAALTGTGTIRGTVENAGELAAGNRTGGLVIQGDLRLADGAATSFDLGGSGQGSSHGFVQVTNWVQFAGSLKVSLLNNYLPASNSVFTLMEFKLGSGSFLNVASGGRLTLEGGNVSARVDYSGVELRLSEFENALPAMNEIDGGWARRYFGHSPLSVAEQRADSDQDGMSNADEYWAGTDPLDPASVLGITGLYFDSLGRAVVRFRAMPDKAYGIAYSEDLNEWHDVTVPVMVFPGDGTGEWRDDGTETGGWPAAGGRRFYRVRLR